MLPKAKKNELVLQQSGEELLVYDLIQDRAICLNVTAAKIWNRCDGETSPWCIANELEKETGTRISEDLIWLALTQLEENGLLENEENQIPESFKLVSRREMVRRVGLSSAVALPIVASMTAPTALNAQSCAPIDNDMNEAASGCPCAFMSGMGDCAAMMGCAVPPGSPPGTIGTCN